MNEKRKQILNRFQKQKLNLIKFTKKNKINFKKNLYYWKNKKGNISVF